MLAEKSLLSLVPSFDDFPYTIRIVTEVLSSNGSTSITFEVKDNVNTRASRVLTIAINPSITIGTSSLYNGEVGHTYGQSLTAAGGNNQYSWSIKTGGDSPGRIYRGGEGEDCLPIFDPPPERREWIKLFHKPDNCISRR
jgi:hypothetical protein